jgi:hypothetical protein
MQRVVGFKAMETILKIYQLSYERELAGDLKRRWLIHFEMELQAQIPSL